MKNVDDMVIHLHLLCCKISYNKYIITVANYMSEQLEIIPNIEPMTFVISVSERCTQYVRNVAVLFMWPIMLILCL
jgi:hypothetical protein